MNHIAHGLGLRQIDPAIHKCPARKFPRQGAARTGGKHGLQHGLASHHAAVACDLHSVLPRKRARGAHHGQQHFVNDTFLGIGDVAIMQRVRRRFTGHFGTGTDRTETTTRNSQRVST